MSLFLFVLNKYLLFKSDFYTICEVDSSILSPATILVKLILNSFMVEKVPYSNCNGIVPNVDWIEQNPIRGNIMFGVSLAALGVVYAALVAYEQAKKPIEWFGGELKNALNDVRVSMEEWDNENLTR